jgi:hypothetical protein
MKNKIRKNTFTKLNETEMKHVWGGDGPRRIEIIIDGRIIIIWV